MSIVSSDNGHAVQFIFAQASTKAPTFEVRRSSTSNFTRLDLNDKEPFINMTLWSDELEEDCKGGRVCADV